MPNPRKRTKRGSATIEAAICLPVLTLLIFGGIEGCNLLFMKQVLTEAAYQGAMVAMRKGATEAETQQRITNYLSARNITSDSVSIAGGKLEQLKPGDTFDIRLSASMSGNSYSPSIMSNVEPITSAVTAVKQ